MLMRADFRRWLWSLWLFGWMLYLPACQLAAPVSHQPTVAVSPLATAPSRQTEPLAARLTTSASPAGAQGKEVHLQVQFAPDSASADFRTQALVCSRFVYIKVAITGIGLTQPIYPTTAPADHMTPTSGCFGTAIVAYVPYGKARLLTVTGYDASKNPIPGAEVKTVFDLGTSSLNMEVSWRSTPTAMVIERMFTNMNELMVTRLDLNALQAFVDSITGVAGSFPNYVYTKHPTSVNATNLADALMNNNGTLSSLTASDPLYYTAPGTVTGTVAGLISSDTAQVTMTDPSSRTIGSLVNGAFTVPNVMPGLWPVYPYAYGYSSAAIPDAAITSGTTLNIGTIMFTRVTPVVSYLSRSNIQAGQALAIYGNYFHPTIAGNTVKFNDTTAVITYASQSALVVTVPTSVAGVVAVTVTVGSQISNAVPLTVAAIPIISDMVPMGGPAGTVVALTGFNFTGTYLVRFNGLSAPFTVVDDTQLTVTAPAGVTTGLISVTNNTGTGNFATSFLSILGNAVSVANDPNQQIYPSLIQNTVLDQFLVVWQDNRNGNYDIYGKIVDKNGVPLGADIAILTGPGDQISPAAVYNPTTNQYMVTWADNQNGDYDLYAQRIDAAGSLINTMFPISVGPNDQNTPTMAYGPSTSEYLVVWADNQGTSSDIYAQRFTIAGAAVGGAILVANNTGIQRLPVVTYNSALQQYLITWEDNRSGNFDIYSQLLSNTGSLVGTEVAVITGPGNQTQPSTTYQAPGNAFWVAWSGDESGTGDIYAQKLSAAGALLGTPVTLSNALGTQNSPRIAYNSVAQQHLVVWSDNRNGNQDLYMQRMDNNGVLIADNIAMETAADDQQMPYMFFNPITNNWLLIWSHMATNGDIVSRRIDGP